MAIPFGFSHSSCPDLTRSSTGAWILPAELSSRVAELIAEAGDNQRTAAQCYQRLGAEWVQEYYGGPHDPGKTFYFEDPIRTTISKVRNYMQHRGAWEMTQEQRAAVDAWKITHPGWEWARCFEASGGKWIADYHYCILDNDGNLPRDSPC
ncbi:hypothetical protein BCR34DRAFT_596350 [Clohesyomyces aquaticus]|uniref:Uncharacterized protein n=1 Tax=Clohesyomyces aquaticus TaxID=1231657 RepID=A0A1Y2A7Z2_9PLEO|nr:hypothetical protein BCR34DRAFT_596350 [Clohesyomyces aquaticus]